MGLDPVVRRAIAVFFDRVAIARFGHVEKYAAPQHSSDAADLRAVRIFRGLGLRVMLPVDGHPLPGDHARREPDPEAEEMTGYRVKIQRAMCLMPMKEYRDRGDREMGQRKRDQYIRPPRQIKHDRPRHGP